MTEVSASFEPENSRRTDVLSALGPLAAGLLLLAALANRGLGTHFGGSLSELLLPIALGVLVALAVEMALGDTSTAPWRNRLAAVGAGLLGATLLVGAWAKLLDPVAFEQTLAAEGLDFVLPLRGWAMIALSLEIGLGMALLLGLRSRWVLIASTALVGFFLFLTGRAYWRFANGIEVEDASCGCFGNLVDRTPAEAFWQDLLMLAPGLLLAFLAWLACSRSGWLACSRSAWLACSLAGWLACSLAGWLACSLAGWLVCSLAGWLACSLAGWLACSLAGWLACSLAGWLACSLGGWLACSLAGSLACSLAGWQACSLAGWLACSLAGWLACSLAGWLACSLAG